MVRGVCEVCNTIGYLQILNNGKYARMRHYQRLDPETKKPIFTYHQIRMESVRRILTANSGDIKPNKDGLANVSMTNRPTNTNDQDLNNSGLVSKDLGGRSLVWSRTSACHADDPGSNLGDRTKHLLRNEVCYDFRVQGLWMEQTTVESSAFMLDYALQVSRFG